MEPRILLQVEVFYAVREETRTSQLILARVTQIGAVQVVFGEGGGGGAKNGLSGGSPGGSAAACPCQSASDRSLTTPVADRPPSTAATEPSPQQRRGPSTAIDPGTPCASTPPSRPTAGSRPRTRHGPSAPPSGPAIDRPRRTSAPRGTDHDSVGRPAGADSAGRRPRPVLLPS